jgi:hypothetical protein
MSNWGKKNATDSDVRRMYIRGRKRVVRVKGVPLEEALALAKISPPRPPAKPKPLGRPKQQIVVVPASARPSKKSRKKKERKRWYVGSPTPGGVLRPSLSPKPASANPALRAEAPPASSKTQRAKSPRPLRPAYDGQPRFEAGIRFVQGGLPELGRR